MFPGRELVEGSIPVTDIIAMLRCCLFGNFPLPTGRKFLGKVFPLAVVHPLNPRQQM